MGNIQDKLKRCIDHLDFGNAWDENLQRHIDKYAHFYDISEAEDILLAELLLCGSESYRTELMAAPGYGMPYQFVAIFRQANLILRHLYTIGRVSNLFQYGVAVDSDCYVPDMRGFHIAAPEETVVVIEYNLAATWSDEQLEEVTIISDSGHFPVPVGAFVDNNGKLSVHTPTTDTSVNEALYLVRPCPTDLDIMMLTHRLSVGWNTANGPLSPMVALL